MNTVTVTTVQRVEATPEQTFATVIPIDLTAIFTGYGPFPAVVDVRDQPGEWDAAGKSRTVVLRGGGFMRERAIEYRSPDLFAYEVVPTKGPLVHLVERINGRFEFAETDHHATVITWTYEFVPKARTRPLLRLLAPLWHRYAGKILLACAVTTQREVVVHPDHYRTDSESH